MCSMGFRADCVLGGAAEAVFLEGISFLRSDSWSL